MTGNSCLLFAVALECSCVCLFICSYDHVHGDKTSATTTTSVDSRQSSSSQTSHCSASRRPVNLHSGVISDVTSTMTSLSRDQHTESSRVSGEGMINSFAVFQTQQKTTTTTVLWPFVRDYLGEPVPEETFTHPHCSDEPSFIRFLHLL